MNRFIYTALTVVTFSAITTAPAAALSERFEMARDQVWNNKLSETFEEAREDNLNKLSERFEEAREDNLNKLSERFEDAREETLNR
jgi:hypothetical protein